MVSTTPIFTRAFERFFFFVTILRSLSIVRNVGIGPSRTDVTCPRVAPTEGWAMAWDFSTDDAYEEQLTWMRGFLREEIMPIETLGLERDQILTLIKPLQDEVKSRGLWAAHLPPELGGMGFGQVKLGLMHEILGQSEYGPLVFGNNPPDSGNAELLAAGMEMTSREENRERGPEARP